MNAEILIFWEQGNFNVSEAFFLLFTASPSAHIPTHFGLSVTIRVIYNIVFPPICASLR
jgi:hypothetical protein